MKIAICVPTFNCLNEQQTLLDGLAIQTLQPNFFLIVDSSSTDGSQEYFKAAGVQVVVIDQCNFNHGATREMARKIINADIIIFMTQDAIPADNYLIEKLVEPIIKGKASFSYARQIPRKGADIFESFPRWFNYPDESNFRVIEDVGKYGVYTFFCSDSCSAYLNSALDEIGGFRPTVTSEDYFAAARLLQNGHRVAYVADAVVFHSHSYTLSDEFKRYFDTGYVRAENPWVQNIVGHAEGRGKDYFKELIIRLSTTKPWLIPYAVLNTFVKLVGYRTGYSSLHAPTWWKKLLSSQRYYWNSKYYVQNKLKRMSN